MSLLSSLRPGDCALISRVCADGALLYRLAALGLREGNALEVVRVGAWGGPLHVRIGTTELLLRRRDAGNVLVHGVRNAPCQALDASDEKALS